MPYAVLGVSKSFLGLLRLIVVIIFNVNHSAVEYYIFLLTDNIRNPCLLRHFVVIKTFVFFYRCIFIVFSLSHLLKILNILFHDFSHKFWFAKINCQFKPLPNQCFGILDFGFGKNMVSSFGFRWILIAIQSNFSENGLLFWFIFVTFLLLKIVVCPLMLGTLLSSVLSQRKHCLISAELFFPMEIKYKYL